LKKNCLRLSAVLFALYLLLLAAIILFKFPFRGGFESGPRVINLIPLQGSFAGNGALVWREVIQNILVFVPMGVYLRILKQQWGLPKTFFAIAATTMTLEVVQFALNIGRADITDIIGNTLGGAIGIAVYAVLRRLLKSKAVAAVNAIALAVAIFALPYLGRLFIMSHFMMGRPPR
jgi:glycopeptide antibiotics resistance protein